MRTDLVQACPACRLRTDSARTYCPQCQAELRRASEVAELAPVAAQRPRLLVLSRGPLWLIDCALRLEIDLDRPERFSAPFVMLFGFSLLISGGSLFIPAFLLDALVIWPCRWLSRRGRPRRSPGLALGLTFEPRTRADAPGTEIVEGRVRSTSGLRSLLEGNPCIASRLVGSVGSIPIDDGRAAPFEVVTDDGEVIAVDPDVVVVDLPLPSVRLISPLDRPALDEFLEARGISRGATPIELGEAVLHTDERVIVCGIPSLAAGGEGYRGTRRALHGDAGSPVTLRRA